MDYKTIRDKIEDMANDNHRDFISQITTLE